MKRFTTGDAKRILKINGRTLQRWCAAGFVRPEQIGGDGRGSRLLFDEFDLLIIATGQNLRARGFDYETTINIVARISSFTLERMQSAWSEGRTMLFVVGTEVFPQLLARDSIYDNPQIDFAEAFEAGVPVAVIDVQAAYKQIESHLKRRRERGGASCN